MKNPQFEKLYKALNPEQKGAVDAVEGPVMVVAGPGTGKTQVLTLRIANILLKTDSTPENILAITFTESGVANMRKRLAAIIGVRSYAVVITTFHGFCNSIIQKYPESFPRIVGARNVTDVEQIAIIEQVIRDEPLEILRPFGDPMFYVRSVLSAIKDLKRQGLLPHEFSALIEKEIAEFPNTPDLYHQKGAHKGKMKALHQKHLRSLEKNRELSRLYFAYEKKLQEARLYDYDDMIMETLQALRENEELLLTLQEEHHYVLVDEHQDTNNAQNKILELLLNYHDNPNLFVVGDEKQAIFRFQGASLENFYYFRDNYSKALLVRLTRNYRSGQAILDAAEALLPSAEKLIAAQKKVEEFAGHNKKNNNKLLHPVTVFDFSSVEAEGYFLVQNIKEKLAEDTISKEESSSANPSEIVILYRNNGDARPLAQALTKAGLDCVIESDQDIFQQGAVKNAIALLKAVAFPEDEVAFSYLLHSDFLGLSQLDVYRTFAHRAHCKNTFVRIISDKNELTEAGVENSNAFFNLAENLANWVCRTASENLLTAIEFILRDSGFLTSLISKGDEEGLTAVLTLLAEVARFNASSPSGNLVDFFNHLKLLEENSLSIKSVRDSSQGKIRLMTVHKSKGLEFDHVYIARVFNGHFGNSRHPTHLQLPPSVFSLGGNEINEGNDIDDERRLFYVALTRARKSITITYSRNSESGREQLPSQFIGEIDENLRQQGDSTLYEEEYKKNRVDLIGLEMQERSTEKNKEQDTEQPALSIHPLAQFVTDRFSAQAFSATALNDYLACPWRYFYRHILRMPQPTSRFLSLGIAVHGALDDFFKKRKQDETDKQTLLAMFAFHLGLEQLSEQEHQTILDAGAKDLSGWYDSSISTWNNNVLTEFTVKDVVLDDNIRLVGKIDKIEFLNDNREVRVVDYKVKDPMSRNEIEGLNKNADGNYHRQLIFYKLLLEKTSNPFQVKEAMIDFIKPNDKGVYKKESFVITDEAVRELEATLKKVAAEISSFAFRDRSCDDPKCDYCTLARSVV